MAALVRLVQLGLIECADAEEQVELVAEVRSHHLRAVGRDRELHSVLDERAECSRTASSPASAFVRRFEVGQISSVTSASRSAPINSGSRREDAVTDPVGMQRLDDLRELVDAELAAFLADVDRHAETTLACELDVLANLRVVVASTARPRPGDVDADDPARRISQRLLDDDHVLLRAERAVHHQDQSGPHLRILERRDVEAADRGEDDVVEIALPAAVPLHRIEAQLERRDPLRSICAADRGVHTALDGERRALDQLRQVIDAVERVEVRDATRVGDRDQPVELPESRVGKAIPCSCARLHMMSDATEPPRCVWSSASPASKTSSSILRL